jgi:hypothetical protein
MIILIMNMLIYYSIDYIKINEKINITNINVKFYLYNIKNAIYIFKN